MNRFQLVFIAVLFGGFFHAQDSKTTSQKSTWKNEQRQLKYERDKKYSGPDDWYGGQPVSIRDENVISAPTSNGSRNIQYNPNEQTSGGSNGTGGNGNQKVDPKVEPPKPIEFPDFDAPEINVDPPDFNPPTISANFWKFLLLLLIIGVIVFLIYRYIKNKQSVSTVVSAHVDNDWNPEIITKSELELRLENAINQGNYREGVRIYFTFILKELVRLNWINWKKDKTNYTYCNEMRAKDGANDFVECVRIFDIVWYGSDKLEKQAYEKIEPVLQRFHHFLIQRDA